MLTSYRLRTPNFYLLLQNHLVNLLKICLNFKLHAMACKELQCKILWVYQCLWPCNLPQNQYTHMNHFHHLWKFSYVLHSKFPTSDIISIFDVYGILLHRLFHVWFLLHMIYMSLIHVLACISCWNQYLIMILIYILLLYFNMFYVLNYLNVLWNDIHILLMFLIGFYLLLFN